MVSVNHCQPNHLAALFLALLAATPAAAQQLPPPRPNPAYTRAVAAGYKAAMLCSAILNARAMGADRSRASVEANELKGIYAEYDSLVGGMPAEILADRVLVRFDEKMPPRVAVSSGFGGCTNLPIGTPPTAPAPARFPRPAPAPAAARWPVADSAIPAASAPEFDVLLDGAFGRRYGAGGNTTAVVIVRDGRIVAERYAPGYDPLTPQRTWSVAKSIAGTLAGMAAKRGLLVAKAPAPVPEWRAPGDPRGKLTLDNLLRMASGLHSDTAGNRTDAVYFGGTAVTEETVAWPLEVAPGTRFRYANNDILLAMRGLRARLIASKTGDIRYPEQWLFAPLGMRHTIAERDWRGNFVLSSQVWASARDLARLGMFWMDDGVWNGQRLLPAGWMQYMTAPSGPQPEGSPGYGATMWLFGPKFGLPAGSFAAQGNRGQLVMVVPSRRLVIVRRGEDPAGATFDVPRFTADILKAIE
ncbi:serine hydrolase [Sphingomonas sp.]|uniref:serine hydrolase domain-containing protein n=1 Tax=Sphingomonas sp. TaxID=28214 RepID=UPI001B2EE261|nr:serine hydrolase [Sphingomonas sp.]MBO9711578.1 serine hydrolase [Sphingomonas sp.]